MREPHRPTEVARVRSLTVNHEVWSLRRGQFESVTSVTPTAGRVDGTPGLVEMVDVALGGHPAEPLRASAKVVRIVPADKPRRAGEATLLDLLQLADD